MKKTTMVITIIAALAMPAITQADTIRQSNQNTAHTRNEQASETSRKLDVIKSALMAYYTENLTWPANLADIALPPTPFYTGDFSTALGGITGSSAGNSYTLMVTDTFTQNQSRQVQFRTLAGKQAGTYVVATRRMSTGVPIPHSASIVRNMLSRMPDTTGSGLNTMQTNIDMGNFDINNIKSLFTESLTATDITATTITGDSIKTTAGADLDATAALGAANATRLDSAETRLTNTESETARNTVLSNSNANRLTITESRITATEDKTTANKKAITDNATHIDIVEAKSDSNTASILELTKSGGTLDLIRSDIDAVNSKTVTNKESITEQAIRLTAHANRLTAVESKATLNAAALNSMKSEMIVSINAVNSKVDRNYNLIAGNTSRISKNAADIVTLKNKDDNLQSQIGILGLQVDVLQARQSSVSPAPTLSGKQLCEKLGNTWYFQEERWGTGNWSGTHRPAKWTCR